MITSPKKWFVYILECKDKSLYTGATNDIRRRFQQHLIGKGSKFVRSRKASKIVYGEEFNNNDDAYARERELRSFYSHIIQLETGFVYSRHIDSHDNLCGQIDKIQFEYLGDERERAGSPQIALDDFDLVIFGHELDVKRPVYMQRLGYLSCDFFHPPCGFEISSLWGQNHRGVSGMDTRILDMFANPSVNLGVVTIALVILVVSGLLAGMIPAQTAIKLKPVDALRSE